MTDTKAPLIYGKMIEVMRNIGAIGKDQKNKQQGFQYRGIDDAYNALHPLLKQEGIFTTSTIIERHRSERQTKTGGTLSFVTLLMEYTFHAEDGSSVSTQVVGEGMDSGDKASNKAMSIADKYALMQAFKIPTEDLIDPDSETPPATAPFTANNNETKKQEVTDLNKTALKEALRDICKTINTMTIKDGIEYLISYWQDNAAILRQARRDLPDFYQSAEEAKDAAKNRFSRANDDCPLPTNEVA